jgi:hypothetical protein
MPSCHRRMSVVGAVPNAHERDVEEAVEHYRSSSPGTKAFTWFRTFFEAKKYCLAALIVSILLTLEVINLVYSAVPGDPAPWHSILDRLTSTTTTTPTTTTTAASTTTTMISGP